MAIADLQRQNIKIVNDDVQTILSEMIMDYEQRTGKTLQPAHIERLLINTFAYREALTRQQMNEAYRQQHVRFASGLMLDLCGDDVNTPRLANESDDAYRERIFLAFESFSVAGSVGSYQYWARKVSPEIVDVHVSNQLDNQNNPIGGTVAVTILTQSGLPTNELILQVQNELSGEKIRPLCDSVVVQAPQLVQYTLNAQLVLFTGANVAEVKSLAQKAWLEWETAKRTKLGGDIVPLDVMSVLKVAGVYNVILNSPNLLVVKPNQWAKCTAINITIHAEQQDG